jgi:electron transport complex protein RnfD
MARSRMAEQLAVLSSPHAHGAHTVAWIMRQVVLALVPAVAVYVWLFGFGVGVQLGLAIATAIACEIAALWMRGLAWRGALADGSVIVLACLLALALPPYAPWPIVVIGTAVAVLLGKHAFGGLGHNVFNPAMVGYVFILLCFPLALSVWPEAARLTNYPGPFDSLAVVLWQAPVLDGVSGATVLDHVKTEAALMRMMSEIESDRVFGLVAGPGWEWINAAYLLGGIWLLWRRVITWRLPAGFVAGLAFAALAAHIADPELHRGAMFHLFAGGAMLAAFFIVTDPVSSATTPRGMLIFGAGVGVLTLVIREWGPYPDGVAFAVVTMNALSPLIDRLTQPRLYGQAGTTDNADSTTDR